MGSFFTFVLTVADGVMSLEVEVPDQHVDVLDVLDVLDALHQRTETAAARREAGCRAIGSPEECDGLLFRRQFGKPAVGVQPMDTRL